MFLIPSAVALFLSAAVALIAIPLVGQMARGWGLVDKPDNTRKLHRDAVPLVGGIVVFLATLVVSTLVIWKFEIPSMLPNDIYQLLVLAVAAAVLVGVGVLDDRFNLRGRQKLVGQIVAVTILLVGGYSIEQIQFSRITIPFGIFSILIVYVWCLAAINSVNLLDGADGFASTVGVITSLSLAGMALHCGYVMDGIILVALAGSLLGFLRYNFPPAKVYLGDAGSMLIGLVIAAIAIRCTFKQAVAYAVFAPVAMLAIPLIDTSAAIIRRRFTGRSIYAEDRGHLHHVMARNGLGPVSSLIWVAALCAMSATGGALSIITNHSEYALASIVMVLAVMIFGKVFGVAEFNLITRKVRSVVGPLFRIRGLPQKNPGMESSIRLQGQRDWEEMWSRLREFAIECELNQIMLDVNAPWMHEGFHADWKRSGLRGGTSNQWMVEIPMIVDGRILARVVVHAPRNGRYSHHELVTNLLKITGDIEQSLSAPPPVPVEGGFAASHRPSDSRDHAVNGTSASPD